MKKIVFLFPYPPATAGSQRFRFEQYLSFLEKEGFQYTLKPFLDNKTWTILYKKGFLGTKIWGILGGFCRRIALLISVWKYDFVFIHREASPIGLPFVEWTIANIFRKKIIFDFDDAIWLPNTSEQNALVSGLKFHQKIASICRWAYKVSAGNLFLSDYAKQFNSRVVINPTTIDTENWHNPALVKVEKLPKTVIGWTGTHSTVAYLEVFVPVLEKLSEQYDFTFLMISDRVPSFNFPFLEYRKWQKETEIIDLSLIDIGIMPLIDDKWARGKCGFKALQYMAMGLVTVASLVGVNAEIIQHQENGYLCNTSEEWEQTLMYLLENKEVIPKIQENARQTIVEKYSVLSNKENFINLFK